MSRLDASLSLALGTFSLEVAFTADERGLILVGPNGAGKTTTLLALLGIRRPARGRIQIGDDLLFDGAREVDVPPEVRRIGYVPQDYALFPHLTALENVAFALAGRPGTRRPRARDLLDRLGAAALADRRPDTLSGGERQKVALARALAVDPRALLLDEPLAALDVEARHDVRAFLAAELRAIGRPFIVITHDGADVRAFGAPVVVLDRGRVAQTGDPEALYREPGTTFVAKLLSDR